MKRGRLYFEPKTYEKHKTDQPKSDKFIAEANKLFKWFKQNYESVKTETHKGFFVSKSVAEMAEEESLRLIVV